MGLQYSIHLGQSIHLNLESLTYFNSSKITCKIFSVFVSVLIIHICNPSNICDQLKWHFFGYWKCCFCNKSGWFKIFLKLYIQTVTFSGPYNATLSFDKIVRFDFQKCYSINDNEDINKHAKLYINEIMIWHSPKFVEVLILMCNIFNKKTLGIVYIFPQKLFYFQIYIVCVRGIFFHSISTIVCGNFKIVGVFAYAHWYRSINRDFRLHISFY